MVITSARRAISRNFHWFTSPAPRRIASRKVTREVLLELVRIAPDNSRLNIDDDILAQIDQVYLTELAYREDLAPLVYNTLTQVNTGFEGCLPVQKFQYMYQVTCRRNAQASMQLVELLRGLKSEGIEPLVLKGPALALRVYADPGFRPFADMDILLRREDLEHGNQVLKELGYRLNHLGRPISNPSQTDLKYRSARQYFNRDGSYLSVDLYWQLSRYPYLVNMDYEALWERVDRVVLNGTSALVLSPEDQILHLSLDFILAVWYAHPELKALRDIAEIVRNYEIDWEGLSHRVSNSGMATPLYFSCRLSQELLGANIPEEALASILPKAKSQHDWVVRQLEKHIFGTGHPVQYAFLVVFMRLYGPESNLDKFRWLSRLLVPPRELWGGIPRWLGKLVLGFRA